MGEIVVAVITAGLSLIGTVITDPGEGVMKCRM